MSAKLFQKMLDEESFYQHQSLDLNGTLRRKTAQESLSYLEPLLKSFGISRVADIGGLDSIGIPVTAAIRPNAKHLCGAQGKGISRELARISAIMEAIESYHFENPPPADLWGSYEELKESYSLVDPGNFPNGSTINPRLTTMRIAWAECLNLADQKAVYIPHELIKLDSSEVLTETLGLFKISSNGLAAGNTLNEAIGHALYELIERDSIWHWQRLTPVLRQQRRIELSSIDSVANASLLETLSRAKLSVEIWDMTTDLGIPSFSCESFDANNIGYNGSSLGHGCHLSPAIALSRAITESIQGRATFISGSRDNCFPALYEQMRVQHKRKLQGNLTSLTHEAPGISYHENYPYHCSASLLENLETMVEALKKRGCPSVLVFHHSRGNSPVPVVQVFVPYLKNGLTN